MYAQIVVLIVTALTLVLFVHGKLRYDFVALLAVLLLVVMQVIKPEDAFQGFSHPAVITVASVLVISSALIKTGAIDRIVTILNKGPKSIPFKILSLMTLTAALSAFMNNIGALALIVPIALKISKDNDIPASKLLMPVSFASLLGGMMTGIGTPPNLIISQFRMEVTGEAFSFFSFTPIGISITVVGILFTVLIGWRLIPIRKSSTLEERFNIEDYLFELVVTDACGEKGMRLKDFFDNYKVGINVVTIIRNERQIVSPGGSQQILPKDILIVKAMPSNLNDLIHKTCLELKGAEKDKLVSETLLRSDDIALVEVVLRNDSHLIGRTAVETKLRNRYNANLIAVSRRGVYTVDRLKNFKFNSGDILLLQAPRTSLQDMYTKMRALPLAEQKVDLKIEGSKFKQWLTIGLFAIAIILAAINLVPVQIAFAATALLLVVTQVVTPREFYDSIEWPTIIMIGSLFVLGYALESSGASATIATGISNLSNYVHPVVILTLLMVITVILTNIINNNAATILMAPIAISVASFIGLAAEPFLMAIAIGASTSFMTPIAHQSNTLVMGPGGYKFTDYWRLGLPLTIISIGVGIPLILLIWPLS